MSQCEPTDLLCSSRREELTLDEQRRLRESIQHSLSVRLMSEILPELERQSRVRAGDDLLLERINARAFARLTPRAAPIKAHAKRRTVMLLVAAAVLLVASLAGAWLGGARAHRTPAPAPPRTIIESAEAPKLETRRRPSSAPPVQRPDAIAPEEIEAPPPRAAPSKAADSKADARTSASELFLRANAVRRQGRAADAALLYERLLAAYPQSREAGPSRLALAKYLQTTQPARALVQFRELASSGGALRAEGLWGLSEVAAALEMSGVAEHALADLRREFPDSPYAEVARRRAGQ